MKPRAAAARRSSGPAHLYLLHVQLAEIEPSIWRRLAVPGPRTLHALHGILQTAMPWQDYHLYQFEIGGTRYEDPNLDDRDPSVPDPRGCLFPEIFCLRSAWAALAPVRQKTVVGWAAMRSWSRRSGAHSLGRRRSSASGWGGCTILRSLTLRRSMCGSAIERCGAVGRVPASLGAALSNPRMQPTGWTVPNSARR
jgi:hypothetical protein